MPKPKWASKKDAEKIERCVKNVKKRSDDVNPHAVCRASVKKGRAKKGKRH